MDQLRRKAGSFFFWADVEAEQVHKHRAPPGQGRVGEREHKEQGHPRSVIVTMGFGASKTGVTLLPSQSHHEQQQPLK